MSKYKVGDKVVLTVTDKDEKGYYPIYVLNDNFYISEQGVDEHTESLSTYTETLEAKIKRQAKEITRLLIENKELKEENKKLFCKVDSYELYGDQHEEEYNQTFNQGAEAAWELARKITCLPINGGFTQNEFEEIFGYDCIPDIFKYTYPEVAAKVAEWEKGKEEIKVGDVLEGIYDNEVKCIVTNLCPDNMAYLVFDDGTAGIYELDNLKKTGRHIDIDSFLKKIGGEQE